MRVVFAGFFRGPTGSARGAGMLWELRVSELRYRAVLEVLDGASVTSVARRFGVARGRCMCGWAGMPAPVGW